MVTYDINRLMTWLSQEAAFKRGGVKFNYDKSSCIPKTKLLEKGKEIIPIIGNYLKTQAKENFKNIGKGFNSDQPDIELLKASWVSLLLDIIEKEKISMKVIAVGFDKLVEWAITFQP